MTAKTDLDLDENPPVVEIHVAGNELSAAAMSGGSETRLSKAQITVLQATLTSLVSDFKPPMAEKKSDGLNLASLEVELSFSVETGTGGMLKLIFDAKATGSIKAKAVWS